jgi:hypothetical protein
MMEKEINKNAYEKNDWVEYEEVLVRVPEAIMRLLRDSKKGLGMTPQEYIERSVVRLVRADLDVGDVFIFRPDQILKQYDLNSVFKILIDDPLTY